MKLFSSETEEHSFFYSRASSALFTKPMDTSIWFTITACFSSCFFSFPSVKNHWLGQWVSSTGLSFVWCCYDMHSLLTLVYSLHTIQYNTIFICNIYYNVASGDQSVSYIKISAGLVFKYNN